MSNDDWLGALNLATMWMFEEVCVFTNQQTIHLSLSDVIYIDPAKSYHCSR